MSNFKKLVPIAAAEAILILRTAPQLSPFQSTLALAATLWGIQAFIWAVYKTIIYPYYLSPLRDLPGPKNGHWLMGQLFNLLPLPSGDPHRVWMSEIPNDGLIAYRHLFNRERVLVTSPQALSEVLVQKNYTFTKPPQLRQDIGQILGVGVLLAEGDEHKRQRRLLNPAFSFRHVKELYPVFWAKSREMVLKMDEALDSAREKGAENADVLEIASYVSRATLDIIGVAGMGHDFNSVQDPDNELSRCYRDLFQMGRPRWWLFIVAVILPFSVLRRLPLKRNKQVMQSRKTIRKVAADLITRKRAVLEKKDASHAAEKDILAVAIQSGGFSDEELIDQLMTFLAAGHETTSSSMQWALYLLCKYPHVQQKLRDEIRTKLPSIRETGPESINADMFEVSRMPYLNATINEILRYFPPVPMTMRIAAHDTTIVGHPIPKDTVVILAPWAVNHSPAQWGPDASEFRPERFLKPGQANSGGAESNFSNLTFLHGPRSCIGMGFAKAEFATLLCAVVGAWEMELKEGEGFKLDIAGGITSRPRGGLDVRFKKIEGW